MAATSYKLGSPTLQVLIPIYPDFNTLDANGPIEVLSGAIRNTASDPPPFKLTVAATTELTTSIEGVRMARDISLIGAHFVHDCVLEGDEGEGCAICTGSLFLGALGKLTGRRATTHWAALPALKKICAELPKAKATNTEIVRARWVDSGKDQSSGLSRLITAGGVSCGLDATFYLLDLTVGPELADIAARRLDYQRRGEELQEDYVIPEPS